jgi:hypothetical protein
MWWVAGGLLLLALSLPAAEVSEVDVHRDGDVYRLYVVARIDASPAAVWKLLTDFNHLERVHRSVHQSIYLGRRAEGVDRVQICMHPCVLFFCVDFTQIVEFHSIAERQLLADFARRNSQFHFGHLQWRLARSSNAGTDIVFEAELAPAFWIPPLLGPWILKRTLRRTATDIVMNLDQLSPSPLP